ncbi:MAG: endonuclease [Chitinophagales bacterium]|nr:endonuclease [Bacteroidota bacterium]
MKYIYIIIFASLFQGNLFADPGNYYDGIDSNLTCSSFKTALYNLIKNDAHLQYTKMDESYNRTDLKPAEAPNTGFVIVDRYCSEIPNGLDSCNFRYNDNTPGVSSFCFTGGSGPFCHCYAKEHTFPKSWFDGDEFIKSDMHFVWPADSKVNEKKSNFALGYVDTIILNSYNGTKVGTSNVLLNFGYNDTTVFEPADAFKGDFARAYLYVATRYSNVINSWKYDDNIGQNVISDVSYTGLEPWILKLCVKWHKQDPPDAFERKRNDSVQAIQGNRNPYIDFPNWVEKVFGVDGDAQNCISTALSYQRNLEFSVYPNPTNEQFISLNFPAIRDEDTQLTIVDVLGRTQFTQTIKSMDKYTRLDIQQLSKGIYFINVNYKGVNNSVRFVKD